MEDKLLETLDQNQIMFFVIVMAVAAIPVGFVAGLFGVGGGLITVPVLFYIFDSAGLDRSFIMHLAVGTSFRDYNSHLIHFNYNAYEIPSS